MGEASREYKVIGSRPIRHDGVDKVTGRAVYGIDTHMQGMLQGQVLRSPHAHARIRSIDVSAARDLDGVHAVMTAADLPDPGMGEAEANESGMQSKRYKSASLMARDKVLFEGHPVAAVAATNRHVAEEALDRIRVDYELLPPVLDVIEAMSPSATLLHDDLYTETSGERSSHPSNVASHTIHEEGDVEDGFASADRIFEREYSMSMVHQGYIEPHNALAHWSADGHLFVECSSQGQFGIRGELADHLDLPVSKINVRPAEIGGGFGGKTTIYLEPLAAVLSRKSGRPVKFTMSRPEILRATGPAPGGYARVKIGVTNEGRITAAQAMYAFEAGGYPGSAVGAACLCAFGPYKLTDFRIDGYDVVVNKPKSHAYRAPGAPQGAYAVDSLVDEICCEMGIDVLDFRSANAAEEGDLRANGTRFHRVGSHEVIAAARASAHWNSAVEAPHGKRRGRGVASGFWPNGGGMSTAVALLNSDGTVMLREGSVDIGGTRTSIAMQAAETLGIPVEDIDPFVPDTDGIAFTGVTGGSRVTFATGWAAIEAARDLQRQMIDGMASHWDVPSMSVEVEGGSFRHNGQSVSFKEAASILDAEDLRLVGSATVVPEESGNAMAIHIADVDVDPETGKVDVVRYTAVQDAGTAIYPPYVEGQIEGGVAQGLGWALSEEYVYDDEGHMRNVSFLDYRMPTTLDVPMIDSIIVEVPNPGHPYGVRGVGEIPVVPPLAAITNAIADAIGVRMRDLPASPRKVYAAFAVREADGIAAETG